MHPRGVSVDIRTYALNLYLRCNCSYSTFRSEWLRRGDYIAEHLPKRNYMYKLSQKFNRSGSVLNASHPGRPKSVRTKENIEFVATHFANVQVDNSTESPNTFCKYYGIMSPSTVRKILLNDIGWKPWKPRLGHKLSNADANRRYWFCSQLLDKLRMDDTIISRMIFFDEIFIKLNSHVCTYNMYFYDAENPNRIFLRKSNGQGLMFLAAVSTRGSLTYCFDTETIPLRFKKTDSKKKQRKRRRQPYGTMPCNSETFLHLFKTRILSDIEILFPDLPLKDVIIVVDGSSIHTETKVTQFFNNTFSEWYGNNSIIPWPSHSPVRFYSKLFAYKYIPFFRISCRWILVISLFCYVKFFNQILLTH